MARFRRLEVLNRLVEQGLVPIFHNSDFEVAKNVIAACVEGGANVVEFTNRGDFAHDVFSRLVRYFAEVKPELMIGVGTVIDAGTAALYINSGANFVVSPVLVPDLVRACNRRKVAHIPGCATLSEISAAEELGAEIIKIFPAGTIGGPDFIKAVLEPHPWTRLMVTGRVEATSESIMTLFQAGATCVGMGSRLLGKEFITRGDYEEIRKRVADVLGWIREARGR